MQTTVFAANDKTLKGFIMNVQQANEAYALIVSAITARNARVESRDNDLTLEYLAKSEKGIKAGLMKFSFSCIEVWANMQTNDKKGAENFIAVKANMKIVRIIYAIGSKMVSQIDDYSATIIANMLANDGVLFAKSALVCLSSNIEYSALDQTQILRSRMHKAVTTASTQRSSTREALRVLGLADVVKGMREDPAKVTEKGSAVFEPLFA